MHKIIRIENMSYQVPYSEFILQNISIDVAPKEFIGILGHNGAGKTTLVDLLLGFRKATEGKIEIMGENPHAVERLHRKDIVFLSQEVSIKTSLSIRQFLKFHASFYPNYNREAEKHLLKVFRLDSESRIGSLSTGQQKKVQVVANLSCCPKLILIDEITAVMDPETRSIFFNELQKCREQYNSTVMLATNIAEDLIGHADKVLFIDGTKANIYLPDEIYDLFNLKKAG